MGSPDALDPAIVEGLAGLPVAELRARRAACQGYEIQLSFVRRLVQGRLDIVQYELTKRRAGDACDLPDLVDHLGEILADTNRSSGPGHLPTVLAPGDIDAELMGRLDAIADPGRLSDPADLDEAELTRVAEGLAAFEREVSGRRRVLLDRIDALQAEIVDRYRTGEANVDTLLAGG